jgi:hypothetical protein
LLEPSVNSMCASAWLAMASAGQRCQSFGSAHMGGTCSQLTNDKVRLGVWNAQQVRVLKHHLM